MAQEHFRSSAPYKIAVLRLLTPMTVARTLFFFMLLSVPARVDAQSASTVDDMQIRNSLWLTSPLRSPAQASVNVEMHEDIPKMAYAAKYKGIANQAERLKRDLESELKRMAIIEYLKTATLSKRKRS